MRQLNWRTVAVLAIGIAVGVSMMATPAAGHVGGTVGHLWKKHIRPLADQRYYTKPASEARYVNVGEKAADAETLDGIDSGDFLRSTGKAADSDKLDNLDSTAFLLTTGTASNSERLGGKLASAFQETCRVGAVKGFAKVFGSATFPSTSTSDPSLVVGFDCAGGSGGVAVRRSDVGEYTVDFVTGGAVAVGSVLSNSAGGSGADDFITVVPQTNPTSVKWHVTVRDADGGNEDATFYLVLL
jgi:hypothetical protein